VVSAELTTVRGFGSALFTALLPEEIRTVFQISRREAADRGVGPRAKLAPR